MLVYKNTLSEFVKGDFSQKTFQIEKRSFSYYAKSVITVESHNLIIEEVLYSFLPEEYKDPINQAFQDNNFAYATELIITYLDKFGTKVRTIEHKKTKYYEKKY